MKLGTLKWMHGMLEKALVAENTEKSIEYILEVMDALTQEIVKREQINKKISEKMRLEWRVRKSSLNE